MTTKGGSVGRASWYDPGDLIRCQNSSLSLTSNLTTVLVALTRPKTINTVHVVLKEERRIVNKRDKPFYVHSLMLIAYWVIIILFVHL